MQMSVRKETERDGMGAAMQLATMAVRVLIIIQRSANKVFTLVATRGNWFAHAPNCMAEHMHPGVALFIPVNLGQHIH